MQCSSSAVCCRSGGATQGRAGTKLAAEKTGAATKVVKAEVVASTGADGAGENDKGTLLMLDIEQDRRLSKVDSIVVSA